VSSGARAALGVAAFFSGMTKVVVRVFLVEGGRLGSPYGRGFKPHGGRNVSHLF
jgi:hypothetical protein